MAFEQLPHGCDLAKVLRRGRHHLEALGALGLDQSLGRQAIQYFAQRADARVVSLLHPVQRQLLAWSEPAEDDVAADAAIGGLADRRVPSNAERNSFCHICVQAFPSHIKMICQWPRSSNPLISRLHENMCIIILSELGDAA